ncbi:hypothetical protein CQW23_04319 [Capsicum baccatum]|uniref:Uncharacterized protein n=1 Tax=Capsicum baccatum TaxID=33114 RepID=A0A2G2XEA7_CAPBA|nr:hypothetical protein CQW23_04319 [Capsicum baccatum]
MIPTDCLSVEQHPVTDDDLVEFGFAGGPAYRPFTRSLESRLEDVTFDALYGLMGTWTPSSNLACTYSQSTPNWLMDSGIQHHLRSDLDNLAIQLEYHGLEEVTLSNGSKLPISHIGKGFPPISDKSHAFDNLFHVPIATQNLSSISSFTNSKQPVLPYGIIHPPLCNACSKQWLAATSDQSPVHMYAMPTNTSCLSSEIPSNTLPTEGENQVADFEQSVPSSDVRHPNELSCSSFKSHPVTTRSQTAAKYAHWHRAMQEEYKALLKNGT